MVVERGGIPLCTEESGLTKRPNWNGPGAHSLPPKKRHKIGIENAMFWPAIDRLKIAEFAAGPPNASSPSPSATSADAHTAFTGVRVRALTW